MTVPSITEVIAKARQAQQDYEQKHDVQLEIPGGLMFDYPDESEDENGSA